MNSSLDNFVKNLSDEDFKYLVEEFDSENLELLKQKDAYPDGHISVKDYLMCEKILKNVFKKYFKKDLLFMADVFEKFISTWLKCYGLDPCHCSVLLD